VTTALIRAATVLALVTLTGLLALRAVGWSTLVVAGGSMAPAIPLGALVMVRQVSLTELRVGDVVTLRGPAGVVTHRVVAIDAGSEGPSFTLKGDANPVADVDSVAFVDHAGLVVAVFPEAGRLATHAKVLVRIGAFVLGAILLAAAVLLGTLHRGRSRVAIIADLRRAVSLAPTDLGPHRRLAAMLLNDAHVEAALAEHARFEAALLVAGHLTQLRAEREYRDATLRWTLASLRTRAAAAAA